MPAAVRAHLIQEAGVALTTSYVMYLCSKFLFGRGEGGGQACYKCAAKGVRVESLRVCERRRKSARHAAGSGAL